MTTKKLAAAILSHRVSTLDFDSKPQGYGVRRRLPLLAALVVGACGSHAGESSSSGESARHGKEMVQAETAESPPGAATETAPARQPSRDLVAEAARAELRVDGLWIDIGSAAMHKYSRGGWTSGWGRNRLDGAESVASIDESSAFLDLVLDEPALEIVVRAKGRGSLGLAVDEGKSSSSKLGSEYQLHRFTLGSALSAGRHRIVLSGKASSVDWLWVSEAVGAPPPEIAASKPGVLEAPSARSFQFHLVPERASQLEFSTEGSEGASIEVVAEQDGKAAQVLVEAAVGHKHAISLATLAGQPTRLTLRTIGGAASFIGPTITRPAVEEMAIAKRPKNVIVLLIDTQRADSFSVVNEKGAIGASSYEALVKSSTTFRNAYNNENWTKPSIASLDTGLYPDSHLARWRKDLCSSDLVFLSEHLQAQGFATTALVSNLSGGTKFGFDQGWDLFEKTDDAEQTFGRADAWLNARDKDKPFFLFVQTIDAHVPFSVPEGSAELLYGGEYKGQLGPSFEQSEEDALNDGKLKLNADDLRWLRSLYDAEVLYHDKHLGLFVDELRAAGTLEDTVFVILNDHGEAFGEKGRWGHGWSMEDAQFRSPLLMHFPGFFPIRTFDEVVEHIDVAPTIVDALGLPAMEVAQGQSLLPLIHDQNLAARFPFSALLFGRSNYRAIRVGDYKLLLNADREQSLFDIATDPGEATNLIDERPIARRLCELAIGEAIANPSRTERLSDRSTLPTIRAQYSE